MDNLVQVFDYDLSTLLKTNVWSAVARWSKVGVLFPPEHTNIEHTSIIFFNKRPFQSVFLNDGENDTTNKPAGEKSNKMYWAKSPIYKTRGQILSVSSSCGAVLVARQLFWAPLTSSVGGATCHPEHWKAEQQWQWGCTTALQSQGLSHKCQSFPNAQRVLTPPGGVPHYPRGV